MFSFSDQVCLVRATFDEVLTPTKTWISNSPIADVFVVWVNVDGKVKGFVLDRGMEGISTPKIEGKLSLRTSVTGMIVLEDVKVPKENMLSVTGMKGPFSCLNSARLGISFGALGAAQYCLEKALEYSLNRHLFNEVLAEKHEVVGYDPKVNIEGLSGTLEEACKDKDVVLVAVQTPHDSKYGGETPTSHLEPKDFDYSYLIQAVKDVDELARCVFLNVAVIVSFVKSTTVPVESFTVSVSV